MIPELGHILVIITFVISTMQCFYWLYNVRYTNIDVVRALQKGSFINFLFIFLSFLILTYSFIISDFSLLIVSNNSHTLKPLIYKISGVWGNHEGSLLLWVLILSAFTFFVSFKSSINSRLLASIIGVQTIILSLFLAFILFTSNPFERVDELPLDGRGLNPLLQDLINLTLG